MFKTKLIAFFLIFSCCFIHIFNIFANKKQMDQLFWFFSRNLILLTIWTHHFTKANMNWKLHQNCFFSISFLCVGKKSSYLGYLILTWSGWWQHLRVMTTFIHQLWCFFIISMHAKKIFVFMNVLLCNNNNTFNNDNNNI